MRPFWHITGQVTKDKTNKEELNMTQYEELLSKINELDKKKADKSEMIYDCIDSNMPEWAQSLFSGVWITVLYQAQTTRTLT